MLGLTPPTPRPDDEYGARLGFFPPYIPEARDTFLALVPDRFKQAPDAETAD